jgi:hypothetical protein
LIRSLSALLSNFAPQGQEALVHLLSEEHDLTAKIESGLKSACGRGCPSAIASETPTLT